MVALGERRPEGPPEAQGQLASGRCPAGRGSDGSESRRILPTDQAGPWGLIPGPSTWKNRNAFDSFSCLHPPDAWHASTAWIVLAEAILFQAAKDFTPTTTTGHQVDWKCSLSSMTKLRKLTAVSLSPPIRDRSIVRGWSMHDTWHITVDAGGTNPSG